MMIKIGDKMYLNNNLPKDPRLVDLRDYTNEIGIVVSIFKRLNDVPMVSLEYSDKTIGNWCHEAVNFESPFKVGYTVSVEKQHGKTLVEGIVVAIDKNSDRIYYEVTKVIKQADSVMRLEVGDINYVESKGRPRETMLII